MSSEIEKFIRRNRKDFDDAAPSGKVWEHIEKNMPAKDKVKRFILQPLYEWTAVAAVFIITLTTVYFLFIKKYSHENTVVNKKSEEQEAESLPGLSAEYAARFIEASQKVELRQKELNDAVAGFPELNSRFREDLNILDSSYRLLKVQAEQSINRDLIFKAMIQNLQLQSELLYRQLMITREYKTIKNSKNEKGI